MLEYHKMRFEFFDKVFLQRDMQNMVPMARFLDKEDVMEINEDLRNMKQMLGKEIVKPTKLFKEIYARVYKEHYQEIIDQIETYATYGTPIEKSLIVMTLILYFTLTRARLRKKNSRQLRSYRACNTCTFIGHEELHFYSTILTLTSIFLASNLY